MLRTPVVFLTGASGEIGHTLIERLSEDGSRPIITLDLKPLDPSIAPRVARQFTGSILDTQLLERVLSEFEVDQVFHLAALLSTRSEFTPVTAHQVNVEAQLLSTRGVLGYVVTDIDASYTGQMLEEIRALPETVRLRVL